MRNFDETIITAPAIDRIANTSDPRLKEIMTSLMKHLHGFPRDVRYRSRNGTMRSIF
jgi:hydroxyquinol 1,2-dioxygenase